MISTRDLAELPDVDTLAERSRCLAVLDAVLCPEWEFRYFTYQADWEPGDAMAMMRNGEGDDYQVVFVDGGAIVKGFAHDVPQAAAPPPAVTFADVPPQFEPVLADEAFARDATTFCFWRLAGDDDWTIAPTPPAPPAEPSEPETVATAEPDAAASEDPDGSERLLRFLDGRPTTYAEWAAEYYGRPLDLEAIQHVYAGGLLDAGWVRRLDPGAEAEEALSEVRSMGYPTA